MSPRRLQRSREVSTPVHGPTSVLGIEPCVLLLTETNAYIQPGLTLPQWRQVWSSTVELAVQVSLAHQWTVNFVSWMDHYPCLLKDRDRIMVSFTFTLFWPTIRPPARVTWLVADIGYFATVAQHW